MKKGVFFILLFLCFIIKINAQEVELKDMFFLDHFPSVNMSSMSIMSNTAENNEKITTGYDKFSEIGKIGLGFLNIFLGLGSYIAGEPFEGLFYTLLQGTGIAIIAVGYYNYGNKNDTGLGDIIGGFVMYMFGVTTYVTAAVYSIFAPWSSSLLSMERIKNISKKNKKENEKPEIDQYINISFPLVNGFLSGQIVFGISY